MIYYDNSYNGDVHSYDFKIFLPSFPEFKKPKKITRSILDS